MIDIIKKVCLSVFRFFHFGKECEQKAKEHAFKCYMEALEFLQVKKFEKVRESAYLGIKKLKPVVEANPTDVATKGCLSGFYRVLASTYTTNDKNWNDNMDKALSLDPKAKQMYFFNRAKKCFDKEEYSDAIENFALSANFAPAMDDTCMETIRHCAIIDQIEYQMGTSLDLMTGILTNMEFYQLFRKVYPAMYVKEPTRTISVNGVYPTVLEIFPYKE